MAITCKKCGLEYLREIEYCGHCGTFIAEQKEEIIYCPVCNTKALHNAHFCVECGKALPQATQSEEHA